MRRSGPMALLLLTALGLLSCGGPGATPPPGSASAAATPSAAAPTSTPVPCPDSPAGGSLPSPLPSPDDLFKVPGYPCSARYEGVADARGVSAVTLTIGHTSALQPYFAPTVLEGRPGESLRLHIVNPTSHLHNISIPDQGINADIGVGGAVDVVVTFPARGPTVYYCSYHDNESQAGELLAVSP